MPQIMGKEVGPVGFGLMGFTWRKHPPPLEQAIETMHTALENGCNLWNGGEFYGQPSYNSMHILSAYFERYPEDADKVVLCMKGGVNLLNFHPDSSPENLRRSLDNIIAGLGGRKHLDMFECARRDPNHSLADVFGLIDREYIKTGKLSGISLSEVAAQTIHDAAAVTTVRAVEVELSLWAPDPLTNGVAAACAQHGIPLVAYSPIGRGMLTGQIKSQADIPEGDFRRIAPRFQPGAFEVNLQLVAQVEALAAKKGCTPAQLAIAWVRALSRRPGMPVIIPIPGATTSERVVENAKLVDLTDGEMDEIDATLAKFEVVGGRYPDSVPTNT